MKTIIRAGFWRQQQRHGRNRSGKQWMNVQSMEFDKPFRDIKGGDVAQHPKAPPATEGWVVHGWYWVNKEEQESSSAAR